MKSTILAFVLTMPNVGSWNGRWSGENNLYVRTRNLGKSKKAQEKGETLNNESFYYNFGDGWGASVRVKIIDAAEGNRLRAKSKGFAGYEWMIDSILRHGLITTKKGE